MMCHCKSEPSKSSWIYVFAHTDKPCSYQNGLRTMIIMVTVGMVAAAVQMAVYIIHNKRVREGKHVPKDGSPPMVYTP